MLSHSPEAGDVRVASRWYRMHDDLGLLGFDQEDKLACGHLTAGSFLHEELDSHGVIATGDQLHGLITEAKFVLGSAAFRFTVTDLLTSGFGALATELQVHIGTEGGGAGAAHPRRCSLPLAKLLAQFHKLSAATLSPSEPFVEALLATPSLDEFCWMAYSGD